MEIYYQKNCLGNCQNNCQNQSNRIICSSMCEALYEVVNDVFINKNNNNNKIIIELNKSHSKTNMIIDVLALEGLQLVSESTGISYDINNIMSIMQIANFYGDCVKNIYHFELAINRILQNKPQQDIGRSTNSCNENKWCYQQQSQQQLQQPQQISINSSDMVKNTYEPINNENFNDTLKEITELSKAMKSINTSVIGQVQFRDEMNKTREKLWRSNFDEDASTEIDDKSIISDTNTTDSFSNDTCSEISNISELVDSTNLGCINSYADEHTNEHKKDHTDECADEYEKIHNEIYQLEQMKQTLDNMCNGVDEEMKSEKENLSKYHCLVNEQEMLLKREKDRLEQDYNIFVSEKEYTYGLIYNKFFIKKQIKGWDCVPALFMVKFPIYLYLDGKDVNGNDVRQRILDTKDDFRLFRLLYEALTCDDFEMPENEEDKQIIADFLETCPPVPIITEADIMCDLNKNTKNRRIFEADETSQCSGSENEEEDDDRYELKR